MLRRNIGARTREAGTRDGRRGASGSDVVSGPSPFHCLEDAGAFTVAAGGAFLLSVEAGELEGAMGGLTVAGDEAGHLGEAFGVRIVEHRRHD